VLLCLLVSSGCAAPATTPSPSPSARGALEQIRARGTLLVSIRMEGPSGGQAPRDPAHAQKRAFEAAVAALIAERAIGVGTKVELRGVGRERAAPVERGETDIAMTVFGPRSEAIVFSPPYAAGGIALAVPVSSSAKRLEDLGGKTIATSPDELLSADAFTRLLAARQVSARTQSFLGLRAAADAVRDGQADAAVGDRTALAVLAKEGAIRSVEVLEPAAYVIAARASATDLLAAVASALAELLRSGEISRAAERAGFPYEAP
jgi:ABC-type amino acid transport substrate-binding protein